MSDDHTPQSGSDPAPLGAVLARARKDRGRSVEDVAAATRIRVQIIADVESDDFTSCGGAIYARGHIRSIASAVGEDPDELVRIYDERFGDDTIPKLTTSQVPALAAGRDLTRAKRGSPRWASAAVVVLAVLVVFLGVTWVMGRGGHDSGGNNADLGPVRDQATTAPAQEEPTTDPAPPTTTAPTTTPPPSGVSLRLAVRDGESWVRVVSGDGDELFSDTLHDGDAKTWDDPDELTVRLGNAPVVLMTLNGEPVDPDCDRIVCTVRFPTAS